MIGRTLDRYLIESKLGEGGMGVVYKARDAHLDRAVAIKVLPPDMIADPERKRRFIQEAKAASAGNLGTVGFGITASRDGRTILYSRVDSLVNDLMLVENFR